LWLLSMVVLTINAFPLWLVKNWLDNGELSGKIPA
jgi:hypothetical protein